MATIKQENLITLFLEQARELNNYLDDDQLQAAINIIANEDELHEEIFEAMESAISSAIFRGGHNKTTSLLQSYLREYKETFNK